MPTHSCISCPYRMAWCCMCAGHDHGTWGPTGKAPEPEPPLLVASRQLGYERQLQALALQLGDPVAIQGDGTLKLAGPLDTRIGTVVGYDPAYQDCCIISREGQMFLFRDGAMHTVAVATPMAAFDAPPKPTEPADPNFSLWRHLQEDD